MRIFACLHQVKFCERGSTTPSRVGDGNYSVNIRKANCGEGDACNLDSSAEAIAKADGVAVEVDIVEGERTAERECEKGFYCELGQREPCPAGTFSLAGALECVDCEPGRYQKFSEGTECKLCEAGSTQGSSARAECDKCAATNKVCMVDAVLALQIPRVLDILAVETASLSHGCGWCDFAQ